MKNKLAAMLLAIIAGMGMFSTTAFAMTDASDTPTETAAPETAAADDQTAEALTPDGNMTLVDDYGTIEAGGKQFITVVTKTGNYFYIIIDRDDEGDETVHFLNMVDEADLLKLMDDEEAQAYVESIAGTTEETTEVVEEPKEPETETATEEEKPEPEKKNNTTGIMALILLAAVGGIGGFLFLKNSKKKKPVNPGPDPDFDYNEDEDDYLAGLEEDEDEVDIMDEDDFEEEEPDPEKPGE